MRNESRKGSNKGGIKPQTYSKRLSGEVDPGKFYFINKETGSIREVSALEFVIRRQANKIAEEQRQRELDLKNEREGVKSLEPEAALPIVVEAVGGGSLNQVENTQDALLDLETPGTRVADSIFDRIKPVPLDGTHQLLLQLTEDGRPLDPDFRDQLIKNGDTAQVEFAVIEGIKRGFEKTRIELN